MKAVERLTNLPHIYINTFTGKNITSKTEYVYARMWYVDEEDHVTFYDSLQIRGRGNSTWSLAKKPYRLKFYQKEKLLGKSYAKTKKWTLLANHADKALIRNAVTSLMGQRAGLVFNPAAKFVDLTLNDSYIGNYQISDQVDVRPHRVDIAEQSVPLDETSDISGGYLLEGDGFHDFHTSTYWDSETQSYLPPDGFYTAQANVPVRIHYPDSEDLDQRQTDYINNYLKEFERRLFMDDFTHPDDGYRAYVDSASLAAWYLCTEMSGNVDGFFSTYFYKEQEDDRLYWGPLWDYDIAYNNDNRTREGTNNTVQQLMKDAGYGNVKLWVRRMWQDPWFALLINRRYAELLNGGMETYLNEKIDSLVELLDASQQLNYKRWKINTAVLRERVLYSTYGEYISDLRSYINRHFTYLQTAFRALCPDFPEPEPEPEPKIPDFPADPDFYYAISNAGTGAFVDVSVSTDKVICNKRQEDAESQQWQIIPLSNGYMYIVNRANGYALYDPTEGEPTATTLTGAQLQVAPGDSLDIRQQWDLVAQAGNTYNLLNRFSQHGANLSGGNSADGTSVLSYTSDSRNAESNNRKWRFEVVGEVEEPDAIEDIENAGQPVDYALAYDPQSGRLHFGCDNLEDLRFMVMVYDNGGRRVRTFRASDGTNLAGLPRGLYMITWSVDGRQRTVKLMKQ